MPLDSANNQVDGPLGVTDVKRDRAFTLVEIIVALGIIMILVGLVTVGMRALNKSAKEKATKSALETAKSMFAELEINKSIRSLPWDQMRSPTLVTDQGADRTGGAVCLARAIIGRLLSFPNNKTIIAKMPTDVLWKFSVSASFPAWAAGQNYLVADRVQNGGIGFIAVQNHTAYGPPNNVGDPPSNEPPSDYWAEDRPDVPVLLDGWRNPIIYVPAGGLSKVKIGSTADNLVKSNEVVSSTGTAKLGPGRPFWASAGPDGDFSTGDDNVYSFED